MYGIVLTYDINKFNLTYLMPMLASFFNHFF